ncbi:antitoxin component HigA of HigAB toxin-antitoxin module [Aquamicrobium terrae]|uniref:Antitoxin component HigA of HigAB toxin-antitoxin module n=1 Tax=Aquamicrobium terrae TaxID=1324945 RepID=A0ABV2N2B8_9HYPH
MATDLKPIRTKADYDEALAEVERLWGADSGTPEGDQLDVLATLIDVHEAKHYPMDLPDPVEAIHFRMEQQGLTRKDLEPMIGPRNRVADVLNPKRSLSIDMIRQLHSQREASIDDQFRIYCEQAKREKWKIVGTYKDAGISGPSMILRPGIQSLL